MSPSLKLNLLTKSVVDVHIEILQDDGGLMSACVVCSSLALADAGLEMFDLVASCSLGGDNDRLVLNPTKEEADAFAKSDSTSMTMCLMGSLGEATHFDYSGLLSEEGLAKAEELCRNGCLAMHGLMRSSLKAKIEKEAS